MYSYRDASAQAVQEHSIGREHLPESCESFNWLASCCSSSVGSHELQVEQQHNNDNECSSRDADSDAREIMRFVLSSEYE